VVWALGSLAAVVGVVHEAELPADLLARLPGARSAARQDFGFLSAPPGAGVWSSLPRNLLLLLAVVGLARPFAGLAGLFALALLLGALGGALGAAGFPPETSGLVVLGAVPPHLVLLFLAALLGVAALGEEGLVPELRPLGPRRRQWLVIALALAFLALAGQGMWIPTWRAYLAGWL
jgi:hypothetical protein